MTVRGQLYPTKTVTPCARVVSGQFVGINAASPTTVIGNGFTVTRTGEGVWDVLFPLPFAAFLAVHVSCTAADMATVNHAVGWTYSNTTRKVTITHYQGTWSGISGMAAEDVIAKIHFTAHILESDVGVVTGV